MTAPLAPSTCTSWPPSSPAWSPWSAARWGGVGGLRSTALTHSAPLAPLACAHRTGLCPDRLCPSSLPSPNSTHRQDQVKLSKSLAGPLGQLQAAARTVAEASQECGLQMDTGQWERLSDASRWGRLPHACWCACAHFLQVRLPVSLPLPPSPLARQTRTWRASAPRSWTSCTPGRWAAPLTRPSS